jgi:hypothetical protein
VNRIDPRQNGLGLLLGTETELQHRSEGVQKAPCSTVALVTERAMVGNTTRYERVCQLQEDGGRPREKEDDLPLKLPADRVATAPSVGENSSTRSE